MKTLTGTIVSTAMNKTVVVEIGRVVVHPMYKKSMHRTRRLKAHVEGVTVAVGDTVKIMATRPISKEKHFKVIEKVS